MARGLTTRLRIFVKQWLLPPALWSGLARINRSRDLRTRPNSRQEKALLRENLQIKNLHKGKRCFVLGAGSSVNQQDIRKLKGEFVISVSNTFVHPDFAYIRSRYHVLPPLLRSHGQLHSEEKFVKWLKVMETSTGNAEMLLHIGDRDMVERNGLFRNRKVHWVEYTDSWDENFNAPLNMQYVLPIWSVSELAITLAVYLGFDEIYLVGFDHDWFKGTHVYFYDHTKEHAMRPDQNNLDFVDSEFQMRRHAKIFRKYKYLYSKRQNIFNANANPDHYLDVFPKVDYESLF